MSDLYQSYKTFSNNEFGEIRVLEIENEPWFVGKDVADALGYSNSSKAVSMHCKHIRKEMIDVSSKKRKMVKTQTSLILEDDVYRLIQNSKTKPSQFKNFFIKWLINENLLNECKVLTSRKEIEFKYRLEKLFEIAKGVVESYINKENSKIVLEMMLQYPVLNYKIDFYFPFFHLAIEYDEYEHKSKVDYDNKRQYEIEKYFESKGSYINFIRVEEGNEEKAIGELIGHLINFSL